VTPGNQYQPQGDSTRSNRSLFQPWPCSAIMLFVVGVQQIFTKEQLSVQNVIRVAPQTRCISSRVRSVTVSLFKSNFSFICFFMVYLISYQNWPCSSSLTFLGLVVSQQIIIKEQLSVHSIKSVAPSKCFISSLVRSEMVFLFNINFFVIFFFMVYLIGAIIADTAVFSRLKSKMEA